MSRETLLAAEPDSFLAKLVTTKVPIFKDHHGRLFIDRDPTYFHVILNYLRYADVPSYDEGSEPFFRIQCEVDFYGLSEMNSCLQQKALKSPKECKRCGQKVNANDPSGLCRYHKGNFTLQRRHGPSEWDCCRQSDVHDVGCCLLGCHLF